jgi:hypothetical protein
MPDTKCPRREGVQRQPKGSQKKKSYSAKFRPISGLLPPVTLIQNVTGIRVFVALCFRQHSLVLQRPNGQLRPVIVSLSLANA